MSKMRRIIALLLLGAIGVVVHLVAGQKASSHESAARVAEALTAAVARSFPPTLSRSSRAR